MNLNEFNEELVKFIEETTEKAVGEYALKNDLDHELLVTAVNTLMSVLINTRFPNTEELKTVMDKALENKVTEIRAKNFGEKVEEQKN